MRAVPGGPRTLDANSAKQAKIVLNNAIPAGYPGPVSQSWISRTLRAEASITRLASILSPEEFVRPRTHQPVTLDSASSPFCSLLSRSCMARIPVTAWDRYFTPSRSFCVPGSGWRFVG